MFWLYFYHFSKVKLDACASSPCILGYCNNTDKGLSYICNCYGLAYGDNCDLGWFNSLTIIALTKIWTSSFHKIYTFCTWRNTKTTGSNANNSSYSLIQ